MTSDLAYYSGRAAQSEAAMISSHDVCAKYAHESLAMAYRKIVAALGAGRSLPLSSLMTSVLPS